MNGGENLFEIASAVIKLSTVVRTHLRLVLAVLSFVLFTHYNNPFTVTAIIECIFD